MNLQRSSNSPNSPNSPNSSKQLVLFSKKNTKLPEINKESIKKLLEALSQLSKQSQTHNIPPILEKLSDDVAIVPYGDNNYVIIEDDTGELMPYILKIDPNSREKYSEIEINGKKYKVIIKGKDDKNNLIFEIKNKNGRNLNTTSKSVRMINNAEEIPKNMNQLSQEFPQASLQNAKIISKISEQIIIIRRLNKYYVVFLQNGHQYEYELTKDNNILHCNNCSIQIKNKQQSFNFSYNFDTKEYKFEPIVQKRIENNRVKKQQPQIINSMSEQQLINNAVEVQPQNPSNRGSSAKTNSKLPTVRYMESLPPNNRGSQNRRNIYINNSQKFRNNAVEVNNSKEATYLTSIPVNQLNWGQNNCFVDNKLYITAELFIEHNISNNTYFLRGEIPNLSGSSSQQYNEQMIRNENKLSVFFGGKQIVYDLDKCKTPEYNPFVKKNSKNNKHNSKNNKLPTFLELLNRENIILKQIEKSNITDELLLSYLKNLHISYDELNEINKRFYKNNYTTYCAKLIQKLSRPQPSIENIEGSNAQDTMKSWVHKSLNEKSKLNRLKNRLKNTYQKSKTFISSLFSRSSSSGYSKF